MKKNMYALVGISHWALDELFNEEINTLELISSDNVEVVKKLKKGEKVALAHLKKQDVRKHAECILAEVLKTNVEYAKALFSASLDEREILTARIQLRYINHARIRQIQDLGQGEGLKVEVEVHKLVG